MSWLSDLAGKAESLLEKVDQSAANALQQEKGVGAEPYLVAKSSSATPLNSNDNKKFNTGQSSNAGNRNNSNVDVSSKAKNLSTIARSSTSQLPSDRKNDDQLFEFLNSGGGAGGEKKRISNQLRSSSPVQTSSPKMPKLNNARQEFEQHRKTKPDVMDLASGEDDLEHSDDSVAVIAETDDNINVSTAPELETTQMASSAPPLRQTQHPARVSNLELENQLLRKEVNSLNEELLSLAQRSKDAQERMQNAEREVEKLNRQLLKDEGILREFQSREDDLREAMNAKDSQLAVLRIRMQESDEELKQTKGKLERFQTENERILKDHTDSSGVQNQVLDDLRKRLQETEISLKHAQENSEQTRIDASERQTKLENEQQTMAETIKSLQKNITELKRNANDSASKLRMSETRLASTNQELRDYKEKAGRILQAKEKVIASLKEGKAIVGDSSGITSAEYEEICQERDGIRDELNQCRYTVEQLKSEIQELEQHVQTESESAQEQSEHLQSLLEEEKRLKEEANNDNLKTRQELQQTYDDHYRQKATLITQIQEKEAAIEKLKNQLLAKSYSTTSEVELENRVRALTENLIQKQTVIEALSTEKSSLVLQLERLELQYKDIQKTSQRAAPTSVYGFDGSDDGIRVHSISSIMPTKITESVKVHSAVNEIDKFSIRLGVFLRRYPIARLMVIVYMILLHLWVFIVLLTYQPEVHAPSTGPLPNIPHPPAPP